MGRIFLSRCQVNMIHHCSHLGLCECVIFDKKEISPGGQDDDSGLQLFRLQQQGS